MLVFIMGTSELRDIVKVILNRKVCSLHNVAIATECQCLLWILASCEIQLK